MRTCDHRYPQCRCVRFGQSRFEPAKRTALDGKVWWCLLDHRKKEYVPWCKFGKRRQALVQMAIDFRHRRIPYEPDPGFGKDWLLKRTAPEVAWLVDHRRLKDETD
jgi:hypothetical protein